MKHCFEISLIDLRFQAAIGVFDQERKVGNEFVVNVSVSYDAADFSGDDDIDSTISYADIYDVVKEEMAVPCRLLETKALEISKKIMARWSGIKSGKISIIKSVPPIPGIDGKSGVTYFFEKS